MRKKICLLAIFLLPFLFGKTQNVAINDDGSLPHSSAMLDVKSLNKGLLIPRVALTATDMATPMTLPATSLLVYNTAVAGAGNTAVTPGFYYWDGIAWVRFTSTSNISSSAWVLGGNTGTNPATHFIGTSDNQPLVFKVNNQLAGKLSLTGGNTSWGYQALFSNTTGINNTAHGYQALYSNTTGNYNTANGYQALFSNTTGFQNTANGYFALRSNTTGFINTATGYGALSQNTTGTNNTANGIGALSQNTVGTNNTANGGAALFFNTIGSHNTATGQSALLSNTTGGGNTANGSSSLVANTTGSANTANGVGSLQNNTTGNNNTAIGYFANVSINNLTNATAIGANAVVDASNKVRIGDANVTVIEGQVAFTNPSDGRFKYNIKEDVGGLDFIMQLKPVTYNFDTQKQEDFIKGKISSDQLNNYYRQANYTAASQIRRTGFIAQEVETAAKKTGFDFDGVNAPQTEKQYYSLSYSSFVVPLVKAVQQQQQQIEKLTKENEELKKLKEKLEALQKAVEILSANK